MNRNDDREVSGYPEGILSPPGRRILRRLTMHPSFPARGIKHKKTVQLFLNHFPTGLESFKFNLQELFR